MLFQELRNKLKEPLKQNDNNSKRTQKEPEINQDEILKTLESTELTIQRLDQNADKYFNLAFPKNGNSKNGQITESIFKTDENLRKTAIKDIQKDNQELTSMQETLQSLKELQTKLKSGNKTKENQALSKRINAILSRVGEISAKNIQTLENAMYYELDGKEMFDNLTYFPEDQDDYTTAWTFYSRVNVIEILLSSVDKDLQHINEMLNMSNDSIIDEASKAFRSVPFRLEFTEAIINKFFPTVYFGTFPINTKNNPLFLSGFNKKQQEQLFKKLKILSNIQYKLEGDAFNTLASINEKKAEKVN